MSELDPLQSLCLQGQQHLMAMQYLLAERTLLQAEVIALKYEDWDTIARLYMPLQEARRQRRQRCGEGTIKLDFIAQSENDVLEVDAIATKYFQGQFLIAGWGSMEPALRFRRIAGENQLYAETFLAAVYPIAGGGRAVAIVPNAEVSLPPADALPIDRLIARLPPHSIVMPATELPSGERMGDTTTFAHTMSLWERLHLPFLATADSTQDAKQRIAAYKKTIAIDYACELAHQKLSDTARGLLQVRPAGNVNRAGAAI